MCSLGKVHLFFYILNLMYVSIICADTPCHNETTEVSDFILYDDLCYNITNSNETDTSIESLKVTIVLSDSLTIFWKVSGENTTSFLIEWFKNDALIGSENYTFPKFEIDGFYYLIQKLDACTEYRITVTAQVLGPTETEEVTAITSKTQPSAPIILIADHESMYDALKISWEKPKIGSSCIKYYAVSAEAKVHDEKHVLMHYTTNTTMIFNHLYPCTSYLITIKPIDKDSNEGLFSKIQSVSTLPRSAKPPTLTNSIGGPPFLSNSSAIILNWNVIDRKNNCSIEQVHTYCQFSYTKGYGFDFKESGRSNRTADGDHQLSVVHLEVGNLSPFTRYICWGWICSGGETSELSLPVPVFTKEDAGTSAENQSGEFSWNTVKLSWNPTGTLAENSNWITAGCFWQKKSPSAPENFKLIDDGRFIFSWEPPKIMPGELQKYRITFSWEPLYLIPDSCNSAKGFVVDNISSLHQNYSWKAGEGFANYTAHIDAHTAGGWSPISSLIHFQSFKKGAPSKVTNLQLLTEASKNDSNILDTVLSWSLPCSLKGKLKNFDIFVSGVKENHENHTISAVIPIDHYDKNDVFSINFGELKPRYYYVFEVSAVVYEMDEKGIPTRHYVEYPSGIPAEPPKEYLNSITLNPEKIQRTTSSAEVLLPLFPNTHGEIKFYAIIISLYGLKYKPAHTRYIPMIGEWLNISSWRESMEQDFQLPYQVTQPFWNPFPNYVVDYGSIKAVKYTIGADITCKDVSFATEHRLYCNGPLKSDTWYEVRMRAFTDGGYSDSPPILFKTDGEVSIFLIIGLVFGILMLGICAALLLAGKSYLKNKDKDSLSEDDCDKEDIRSRRLVMNSRAIVPEIRRYEHNTE